MDLTRRDFIAAMSVSVFAAACRPKPYDAGLFQIPASSPVGLFAAPSYDIDFSDLIGRGLRELAVDVRGRRVFLKPNMVEYEPGTAINTDPRVVIGAVVAFRKAGAAEVTVGEGPGHRRDTEYLITRTGLYDHLREHRTPFVDLNEDDVQEVTLASGFTKLERLALPTSLLRADFIVSMPKLKTHHWAGMTAGMKNLFGTVPGAVYGWPKNILHRRGIDESILDLNATIRPQMSIVDAVTAMEGDGPIMGKPRHAGFIAMSTDIVAGDATCCRAIGLNPSKLPYLREAGEYLGNLEPDRIEHRGERLERFASRFDVIDSFKSFRLEP
jgi:uncharacterized protein (DUF362 family)